MNFGNYAPYRNEKKIPDYATKDYVFCDLCKRIERIPKPGENKHWQDLWPLSLEDIKENGVESYDYYNEELRREIVEKLKEDMPSEIKKTENLLEQLHRTAENAGFRIISDDHCCRLLAWLLVYGGGREEVVFNDVLRTNIFEAQRRLNIFGGEIPQTELMVNMQEYVKSIEDVDNPPEWALELEKRYGLKSYRGDVKK
jgi:hypothetical protein